MTTRTKPRRKVIKDMTGDTAEVYKAWGTPTLVKLVTKCDITGGCVVMAFTSNQAKRLAAALLAFAGEKP